MGSIVTEGDFPRTVHLLKSLWPDIKRSICIYFNKSGMLLRSIPDYQCIIWFVYSEVLCVLVCNCSFISCVMLMYCDKYLLLLQGRHWRSIQTAWELAELCGSSPASILATITSRHLHLESHFWHRWKVCTKWRQYLLLKTFLEWADWSTQTSIYNNTVYIFSQ